MKHLLNILFAYLISIYMVLSQNNIVPNYNFENGLTAPYGNCNYPDNNYSVFDLHVFHWFVADKNFPGVWGNVQYKMASPDWIYSLPANSCLANFNTKCTGGSILPTNVKSILGKWVSLGTFYSPVGNGKFTFYREAIRAELTENLNKNKVYVIRYKYVPLYHPHVDEHGFNHGSNHLRVHFTTKGQGKQWDMGGPNGNGANSKWNDVANLIHTNVDNCSWGHYQNEILVPNTPNSLKNVILYAEAGGFGLDDIELYEKCPISMVLQNRTFDNYFYSSFYQNGQNFIYEATDYLYAGNGNWQNTPELIVEKGADMIFRAGQGVDLLPGFTAENNLDVYIAPCGGGNRLALDTTEHPNTQFSFDENESPFSDIPDISVYPNPSTGLFIIESEEALNINDVEVYDVFGKRIQIMPGWLDSRIQVNFSGHSKGLYLLRIGAFTQRLVLE